MEAELEAWLAQRARALGLDAENVEQADALLLRAYCREVLGELAARGRLAGRQEIGCYAALGRTQN
ncbi:hypothetical protein [Deinococcus sp.]|uniref:hypothetical protein n=1 Tax=Deinococcus sp. TaxID=47478 RepID=UPI003CC5B134